MAKASGHPINSAAQDGTYAAGVHRVKELLPVLMNDIMQSAPDDQKVRFTSLDMDGFQKTADVAQTSAFPSAGKSCHLLTAHHSYELPTYSCSCLLGENQEAR